MRCHYCVNETTGKQAPTYRGQLKTKFHMEFIGFGENFSFFICAALVFKKALYQSNSSISFFISSVLASL